MRSVSVIANLWRLESTGIFCTNDIIYHSLWPHLPSLPYQFLIFEDVEDWQPSPGVGHLPTWAHAPLGFSQAHGFWLELQTEKKMSSLAFWQGLIFFLIVRSRVGNVSLACIFWSLHIRNAGSNPTPLCNGWELLQYTVLIGVIQGLEHLPSTFCHHRRVHCTCIWLFTADSGWAFNDVSYHVRYHRWLVALRGKLSDVARRGMIAFCRGKGALKNVNILTVSRAVALISQENLYPLT